MKTFGLLVFLVCLVASIESSLVRKRHSYYSVTNFAAEHNSDEREENTSDNPEELETGTYFDKFKEGLSTETFGNKPKTLLCYYKIPTLHDKPYPVFPEVINSSLCTHLVVCSAKVQNLTLAPEDLGDVQFYSRVIGLKKSNPNLKVLLRLESVNDETGRDFVSMISSNETQRRFIRNAVQQLTEHGFDGIEVSWNFPCFDGPSDQKQLFSEFLSEFRGFIDAANSSLLLTAAVAAEKEVIDIGYDIRSVARSVDFVSLMSYDYHTFSWLTPITGPNAPKTHMKNEIAMLLTLNMEWSANYWYQNGMPASKVIVGIPTYGRAFTLVDALNHGYYTVASSVGEVGNEGYATFAEVSSFLRGPNVTVVFDNDTGVPYAYSGKEWISYENERSAQGKTSWILQSGFGGVAITDLNADDPYAVIQREEQKSKGYSFPITQAVHEILFISRNQLKIE